MNHELKTIRLYGSLAELCETDSVELAGNDIHIIVRGLISRFGQKVKNFIMNNNFIIDVDDENIDEEFVKAKRVVDGKVIHFFPAIEGSGRVGRIILGIVLVVVGFIVAPANPALGQALVQAGVGLVLTTIFAPKPTKPKGPEDERASFLFNGAVNTNEAGGPVPLVYGRFRTGTVVVSAGISTTQLTGLTGVGNNNNSGTAPYGDNPFYNPTNAP